MKKTAKKTLALVLALVLTVGLAACGAAPAETTAPPAAPQQEEAPKAPALSVTEENTFSKPMPNLPEVPYFFPNDLLAWDPAQDPVAVYNVSSIPLAKRVDKDTLTTVNPTQNKDVNIVALCGMNTGTSGSSPHGLNTANANVFSYWQYIDKMVYWGGSSGEGLIVVPSADVIDAGHRNGVPVLGTVFFPQTVHGGKIQWLNDFLVKDENGEFPMADKLIEVCNYFGFDGWFINQETEGTEEEPLTAEHAVLMQEFIKAFEAKAGDDLELMWYDAMTIEGKMDWQNALTDKNQPYVIDDEGNFVADSMFLNFWWTYKKYAPDELLKATAAKAAELGVDPYDLYAGIDVQANGTKTKVRWELYAPDGQAPYTSLGLYCPSWAYETAEDFFTDFQEKENSLWVNHKGDPFVEAPVKELEWRGISTYAVEQTVVNKIPFITNFSMGHGYSYFIEGRKVSNKDWNNRSMQDVLPTYRWHLEQGEGNALKANFDYSDAYNGGTSMKLYGKTAKGQPTLIKLYSAELPMTEGLSFTTTAKATLDTTLDLVLTLSDGTTQVIPGDKTVGSQWTTVSYDVSGLAGKTVTGISYQVTTAEDGPKGTKIFLGQIAVTAETPALDAAVTGLKVDGTSFDDDDCIYSGVRLRWDAAEGADFYEIYRVNQDESVSFLGVTPATTHYLNALERNDATNKTHFRVVPVNVYGSRGAASEIATMEWPDNSLPKADFKASATLAAPGQDITFKSMCSTNTETVEWEFPGASEETASGETVTVSYAEEGTYTVKATAKNASGEAVAVKEDLITVSAKVEGELSLLSQGKETSATAYVNDNEAPQFAVDGDVTKKWCATGNPPHELTIDLGSVMTVSEVKVFHAEAGGEGATMNTKAYTILVSEDGENFTEVVKVTKNFAGESSDTFPAVSARYVKLSVVKPTQGADTAARIYEVQVYGLEGGL